ncbi:hypothetical protein BDD12DRAFT_910647 [Trichophaea hybrida]|nr:hypothetical protein BDD12DRAFT_910647 [Trichophaea hybrida]
MQQTARYHNSSNTYCWPADWSDVAKFFIANYFTHAFTDITHPGERTRGIVGFMLWSLFMPFAGVGRAVAVIAAYARGAKDDLTIAHRAGALYTLVKIVQDSDGKWHEEPEAMIPNLSTNFDHWLVNVHGIFPDFPEKGTDIIYHPACVPPRITVHPLVRAYDHNNGQPQEVSSIHQSDDPETTAVVHPKSPRTITHTLTTTIPTPSLKLGNNYSAVKAELATFQVLYGSWELYLARGKQLDRYGYAAFSLTVVPYIAMSLLNLVATLCRPQYSHVYLVNYPDSSPGDVKEGLNSLMGDAVGTMVLSQTAPTSNTRKRLFSQNNIPRWLSLGTPFELSTSTAILQIEFAGVLGICAYLAPYIVDFVLTGFKPGTSTELERQWIVAWLVSGQILGFLAMFGSPIFLDYRPLRAIPITLMALFILAAPGIGVFVIVARMVLVGGVYKII